MSKEIRQMIDQVKNFGKSQINENVNSDITQTDKVEILKKDFPKEFNKYYKAMSYRIMSVEVDALYNVLVLGKKSKDELTKKWEYKVKEILGRE